MNIKVCETISAMDNLVTLGGVQTTFGKISVIVTSGGRGLKAMTLKKILLYASFFFMQSSNDSHSQTCTLSHVPCYNVTNTL